jgi:hypothetical protein
VLDADSWLEAIEPGEITAAASTFARYIQLPCTFQSETAISIKLLEIVDAIPQREFSMRANKYERSGYLLLSVSPLQVDNGSITIDR